MRRPGRSRLAFAGFPVAVLLAAALLLAGCGSSGSSGARPAVPLKVITVKYAGGVITPPEGRVIVKLGGKVEIRVTSDVPEIVHNHFNNVEQDVAAGGTVVFDFTANKPGIYEVELHKSNKLLLELQVQ